MEKLAAWLNAQVESNDGTNGDFLRAFLTSFAKAIISLLDFLGEWPIDFE